MRVGDETAKTDDDGEARFTVEAGRVRICELGTSEVATPAPQTCLEEPVPYVAVRTAKGAGSTFTFALPRSARDAQRAGQGGTLPPGMGEDSSIREFMRQIGIPSRRGTGAR